MHVLTTAPGPPFSTGLSFPSQAEQEQYAR